MPPFVFIDGEAFRFHGAAEQVAVPALERSAAGIVGEGTRRHFIVSAGHFDGFAGGQVVEREVHGATAIVTRAFLRIGNKNLAFCRGGVPENFGDVPGAIGVVNEQAVAQRLKFVESADKSHGGGALQERASLSIDGSAEEVVRRCVANVEMNLRIEGGEFDEFGFTERALFHWRRGRKRLLTECPHGTRRSDVVGMGCIFTCIGTNVTKMEITESGNVASLTARDAVSYTRCPFTRGTN